MAKESASAIVELAEEGSAYCGIPQRSYFLICFAKLVAARVTRIAKKVRPHERVSTECEDDYVNRVARDEAGSLKDDREVIAATLEKHAALTPEQLRSMSAKTVVEMKKLEDELGNEDEVFWSRPSLRKDNESDDDLLQRVAQDEAGEFLLKKRQILADALRALGTLREDEVTRISSEIVVHFEKEYEECEYYRSFLREDFTKECWPLLSFFNYKVEIEGSELKIIEGSESESIVRTSTDQNSF